MIARSSRILLPAVCLSFALAGCGSSSSSSSDDEGLQDDPTGQTDAAGGDTGADTGADDGEETGETAGSGGDTGQDADTAGSDGGADAGTGDDGGSGDSGDAGAGTDTGSEDGTGGGLTSGSDTGSDDGSGTASDSDDDASDDGSGADTGSDGNGTTSGGSTDDGGDTGTNGDDSTSGGSTDDAGDNGDGTSGDDAGSDDGTDTTGDAGADTGGGADGDGSGGDTGDGDSGSGSDKPEPDMLLPDVEAGSAQDRLVKGIDAQVARTLLDLNQSLNSGMTLTPQQEDCLGAYDPAFGEQLTMIDCTEQPLATGDIALYVVEAAYYDTDDCHASLLSGSTDDCVLQRAQLIMPTTWTSGPGLPRPDYAGSLIDYGVKDSAMTLMNNEAALEGYFHCSINLDGGAITDIQSGGGCSDRLSSAADEIERLLTQE